MDKSRVTIHDIAKALNIDGSTVSRALNDSDRVTAKTRAKILAKAEELGYQRNILATNLRKNATNTIGVIVPRISRHFFSSAIAGIEETAYENGYNVIICQSLEQLEREQIMAKTLLSNRVEGVLISVSMETTDFEHLLQLKKNGIRFLFFDRHCDIEGIDSVLTDDFQGGFDATEHLIEKGCKRIAHFSGPNEIKIYQNRLAGYKAALEENKIPFNPELVFKSRLMEWSGTDHANDIVNSKLHVDGIFAANDVSAIGAIKYFKKVGVKVPSEIAIVGFSNEPISEVIDPSLSTMEQSGFLIGKKATEILVDQIKNGANSESSEKIILKSTLIERNSSKK